MMVHLYWLDATKPSLNGDCPEGPEKHIFNTNAGNLRPAIQGMQKRAPEECIGNYSPQLVRVCGYWFWHYFGSITQRQAWAICFRKLQEQRIVYAGASLY